MRNIPETMKIVWLPDGTKEYVPDWDETGTHESPIETEMHRLIRGALGPDVAIVPQCEIGPYRVDFALRITRANDMIVLVVECDGRQYHRDFIKDAERDRDLARYGVAQVLRATGSEIFSKPVETRARIVGVVESYKEDRYFTRDHVGRLTK